MKLLLKLAWRNIWRNKRRSMLTLGAIIFATFASVAMRGLQKGTYAVNIKNAVNMFSGYVQIQKVEYQQNPSLRKSYKNNSTIAESIESIPEIKGYSSRVYADGLISFKDNSQGAGIFGIDPVMERQTTKIMERIDEGRFFDSDTSFEIVLGKKLMQNLKADIGDDVVVLSQGYDGSLGNFKFKIIGTVKMGMQNFDAHAAFISIKTAQELVAMYNRIHITAIKLDDLNEIETVKELLTEKLNDPQLAVLAWNEVMPDFEQSIEFDNVSGIFMLLILVVIVAFGILNTVLMSVTERFNEFGITLSIGMPQMKLVYLILIETVFLTIFGVFIGDIIGWLINSYIIQNPIDLGAEFGELYELYGFLPILESSNAIGIFINTTLTIVIVSILSVIYPLVKVYKLEPLKGIRYT